MARASPSISAVVTATIATVTIGGGTGTDLSRTESCLRAAHQRPLSFSDARGGFSGPFQISVLSGLTPTALLDCELHLVARGSAALVLEPSLSAVPSVVHRRR
jgi:hypothetical protein